MQSGGHNINLPVSANLFFGSGFHPSARFCLETLLKYATAPEAGINTALDLGTGTRLLAIAAAKKGVKNIMAADYNQLACEVAQKNACLNSVEDHLTIRQMDLLKERPQTTGVDLVVANLYKTLLVKLFDNPEFWFARMYIFAGFIPPMEEDLLATLPTRGMRLLERRRKEQWCL